MMAEETAPSGEGNGAGSPERGAPSRQEEEVGAVQPPPATPALCSEEQECRICYHPFDPEARAPKMLECLHTFCLACLKQMGHYQALRGDGGGGPLAASIACPLCRHRSALSEERLRLLPLNAKLLPPPPPPDRWQFLPRAEASPRPILQRPLPVHSGQRRESPPCAPSGPAAAAAAAAHGCHALEQSRRPEARAVRCVCLVFTFFSRMVVSITGPLVLNYSGWVELFMVSLFLVVALGLALFSVIPCLLHGHRHRAGQAAGGPTAGVVAAAAALLGTRFRGP